MSASEWMEVRATHELEDDFRACFFGRDLKTARAWRREFRIPKPLGEEVSAPINVWQFIRPYVQRSLFRPRMEEGPDVWSREETVKRLKLEGEIYIEEESVREKSKVLQEWMDKMMDALGKFGMGELEMLFFIAAFEVEKAPQSEAAKAYMQRLGFEERLRKRCEELEDGWSTMRNFYDDVREFERAKYAFTETLDGADTAWIVDALPTMLQYIQRIMEARKPSEEAYMLHDRIVTCVENLMEIYRDLRDMEEIHDSREQKIERTMDRRADLAREAQEAMEKEHAEWKYADECVSRAVRIRMREPSLDCRGEISKRLLYRMYDDMVPMAVRIDCSLFGGKEVIQAKYFKGDEYHRFIKSANRREENDGTPYVLCYDERYKPSKEMFEAAYDEWARRGFRVEEDQETQTRLMKWYSDCVNARFDTDDIEVADALLSSIGNPSDVMPKHVRDALARLRKMNDVDAIEKLFRQTYAAKYDDDDVLVKLSIINLFNSRLAIASHTKDWLDVDDEDRKEFARYRGIVDERSKELSQMYASMPLLEYPKVEDEAAALLLAPNENVKMQARARIYLKHHAVEVEKARLAEERKRIFDREMARKRALEDLNERVDFDYILQFDAGEDPLLRSAMLKRLREEMYAVGVSEFQTRVDRYHELDASYAFDFWDYLVWGKNEGVMRSMVEKIPSEELQRRLSAPREGPSRANHKMDAVVRKVMDERKAAQVVSLSSIAYTMLSSIANMAKRENEKDEEEWATTSNSDAAESEAEKGIDAAESEAENGIDAAESEAEKGIDAAESDVEKGIDAAESVPSLEDEEFFDVEKGIDAAESVPSLEDEEFFDAEKGIDAAESEAESAEDEEFFDAEEEVAAAMQLEEFKKKITLQDSYAQDLEKFFKEPPPRLKALRDALHMFADTNEKVLELFANGRFDSNVAFAKLAAFESERLNIKREADQDLTERYAKAKEKIDSFNPPRDIEKAMTDVSKYLDSKMEVNIWDSRKPMNIVEDWISLTTQELRVAFEKQEFKIAELRKRMGFEEDARLDAIQSKLESVRGAENRAEFNRVIGKCSIEIKELEYRVEIMERYAKAKEKINGYQLPPNIKEAMTEVSNYLDSKSGFDIWDSNTPMNRLEVLIDREKQDLRFRFAMQELKIAELRKRVGFEKNDRLKEIESKLESARGTKNLAEFNRAIIECSEDIKELERSSQ